MFLASCDGSDIAPGYYFPTHGHVGEAAPTGLLEGRLVARGPCVLVEHAERRLALPVWPEGFDLVREGGVLFVRGDGVNSRMGDVVALGGGETEESLIALDAAPEGCRDAVEGTWMVYDVGRP